jgi:hypothetical protein
MRSLSSGTVIHLRQHGPRDVPVRSRQTDLTGNAHCSGGVVTRDHDHTNARGTSLGDRGRHGVSDRIGETDETDEFEREIVLQQRQIGLPECRLCDT